MDIKKCKFRLRCEMGACGKRAEYTIQPARVGIRSSVHICGDCLDAIIKEGGKALKSAKAENARADAKPAVARAGKKAVTALAADEIETAAEVLREA